VKEIGEEDDMSKLILSRRRLFELVWAKPMTQLAQQFGVHSKHLARACDRHDIPRPRPGHWQKLAYGQTLPMVELPEDNFRIDSLVVIEVDTRAVGDRAA
jgi:hypothetical protein